MIGDHIRTLKAGRWTHAIDCGDETVIVLGEDAAQQPLVRRSYRPTFVAGADAVEIVLHRERTFPAEQVVARAYSRIADAALASMFRDSEAFAEWCTTGRLPAGPRNVAVDLPAAALRAPTPAPIAPAAAPITAPKANAKPAPAAKPKAKPAAKAKPVAKANPARVTAKAAAKPARAKPARKAASKPAKRAAKKPARRRARR